MQIMSGGFLVSGIPLRDGLTGKFWFDAQELAEYFPFRLLFVCLLLAFFLDASIVAGQPKPTKFSAYGVAKNVASP